MDLSCTEVAVKRCEVPRSVSKTVKKLFYNCLHLRFKSAGCDGYHLRCTSCNFFHLKCSTGKSCLKMIKLDRKLQRVSLKWIHVFYRIGKFLSKRIQFKCNFLISSKPIRLFERTPLEANGIFVSYQILSCLFYTIPICCNDTLQFTLWQSNLMRISC